MQNLGTHNLVGTSYKNYALHHSDMFQAGTRPAMKIREDKSNNEGN